MPNIIAILGYLQIRCNNGSNYKMMQNNVRNTKKEKRHDSFLVVCKCVCNQNVVYFELEPMMISLVIIQVLQVNRWMIIIHEKKKKTNEEEIYASQVSCWMNLYSLYIFITERYIHVVT